MQMELHERQLPFQKLSTELQWKTCKNFPDDISYNEIYEVYGMAILSLTAHFANEERDHTVKSELFKYVDAICEFVIKNEMTYGEAMMCISGMISTDAKYLIRGERHPEDPSKPGGLA